MMEVKFNAAQSVFTLFYAVTWGALANVWPRWQAFHWSLIGTSKQQALQRSILSLVLLNIVPLIFFIVVFLFLNQWRLEGSWWSIFGDLLIIMLQPFVLYGFYMFWVSIVQRYSKTFYPDPLDKDLYPGIRRHDLSREFACRNLLAGLTYIMVPPLVWCLFH